jgi:hypothetical protein
MGRACSIYVENGAAYRILVGKPKEKRPPGRSRRRKEDNIEMYLREYDGMVCGILILLQIGTSGGLL